MLSFFISGVRQPSEIRTTNSKKNQVLELLAGYMKTDLAFELDT